MIVWKQTGSYLETRNGRPPEALTVKAAPDIGICLFFSLHCDLEEWTLFLYIWTNTQLPHFPEANIDIALERQKINTA